MLPPKISDKHLELLKEVFQLPELKRLRKIRFLGAIDYISKFHSREYHVYSRYEHTKGVVLNTISFLVNRYHYLDDEYMTNSIIISALHDIGHIPFSHSLESLYYKQKSKDHHDRTLEIIDYSENISSLLKKYNVKKDMIIELMSNRHKNTMYSFILNDKINMDTIDGIFRSLSSFNKGMESYSHIIKKIILSYCRIHKENNDDSNEEGLEEDLINLDLFWRLKDLTYKTIIQSKYGISCDAIFEWIFERNHISIYDSFYGDHCIDDDYYIYEYGLYELLHKSAENKNSIDLDVKFNEFCICRSEKNVNSRYGRNKYIHKYTENLYEWKLENNFLSVHENVNNAHQIMLKV